MPSPDVRMPHQQASPDDQEYEDADETLDMTEVTTENQRAGSNDSSSDPPSKTVTAGSANGKPNPKDPLRPRRKKARRACFACQRAHLTCGELWPFEKRHPKT